LRRQWKNKRGGAFPPSDCTAQTLRFETAELLHKIGAFHESDVRKVQVTEDLVLEATRSLLVWTRQVQTARVAAQAFLVVMIVIVQRRRFCNTKHKLVHTNSH
jgi:hypothetical protein